MNVHQVILMQHMNQTYWGKIVICFYLPADEKKRKIMLSNLIKIVFEILLRSHAYVFKYGTKTNVFNKEKYSYPI